jgi:hypothetical protein
MDPCRGHDQMNFACAVPDLSLKSLDQLEYLWNARGNVEELGEAIHGFPDWLRQVFRSVNIISPHKIRGLP